MMCSRLRPALVLRCLASLAAALFMLSLTSRAHADTASGHTVPVAVLALDSDDAEAQADALTSAFRSRIRASQGWSLVETTHSLGMLTAALKCQSRPSAECQQKIGDQIKAERYIWGFVNKSPGGHVTAEVHLYQRNKPDTVYRESYADNLKDGNDENLRKIAQRIIEKLGGSAIGIVVVKAGQLNGEVIIDGDKRVPLEQGSARLEVAAGGHSVEVSAPSIPTTKRTVLVVAGKETEVEIPIAVAAEPPPEQKPSAFPTRKVVGGVVTAAGVALEAVAVVGLVGYLDAKDRGYERYDILGGHIGTRGGEKACDPNTDAVFCEANKDMVRNSVMGIVTAGVGAVALGTGLYLLFTEGKGSEGRPEPATAKRTRVIPTFSEKGQAGLLVTGSF